MLAWTAVAFTILKEFAIDVNLSIDRNMHTLTGLTAVDEKILAQILRWAAPEGEVTWANNRGLFVKCNRTR
jgi:hypothetical protein